MSSPLPNTVFLRLEGPMQSWGVGSRHVVRDTAEVPTKSGVLGLVCCAMGVRRSAARPKLAQLNKLSMGIRVDRPGWRWSDYHTVGAGYGVMSAEGKIKRTQTTGDFEPVVSRRYYLCDASFLAALHGDPEVVNQVSPALRHPKWPVFLGRKSCPPSRPILEGEGGYENLQTALESRPWAPRLNQIDGDAPDELRAVLEFRPSPGEILPPDAYSCIDEPVSLSPPVHRPRFVVERLLRSVQVGPPSQEHPSRDWARHADYTTTQWQHVAAQRLTHDEHLCVFCKQPASPVHHVSYQRVGREELADLRSLCRVCHDAVTMLEYGRSFGMSRIDPCDPAWRDAIRVKRDEILAWRSLAKRRRLLLEED